MEQYNNINKAQLEAQQGISNLSTTNYLGGTLGGLSMSGYGKDNDYLTQQKLRFNEEYQKVKEQINDLKAQIEIERAKKELIELEHELQRLKFNSFNRKGK